MTLPRPPANTRWSPLALAAAMVMIAASACNRRGAPPIDHRLDPGENAAATTGFTVTIGYQRSSWAFLYLRRDGQLEARLAPLGGTVRWLEFTAGPPILEGMNAGAVDVALVGDTPPIYAQSSGLRFAYAAVEPPKPQAAAILVPAGSRVQTVSALKGRKIALQKGSTAHHLLIEALVTAGLAWADIHPVYLAPPDARAAFQSGAVDAWAIWDPYFAAAEVQLGARPLTAHVPRFDYRQFLVVRPDFPGEHRAAYEQLLAVVASAEQRLALEPSGAAALLASDAHLDPSILTRALGRGRFGLQPLTDAVWREQQELADLFASLHLLNPIPDVRSAALDAAAAPAGSLGVSARR